MVIESHIFEHCSELDGVIDLGFFFWGEADALGVASTLDVEDSLIGPDMLIITDQFSVSDSAEGGLSGS